MSNLSQLLQFYKGTLIPAPIAIGVQAVNKNSFHVNHFDCHCSSDDCAETSYDCHCCSDDCAETSYDCHCCSDDCAD